MASKAKKNFYGHGRGGSKMPCRRKKFLVNQGCTIEQILVWQDCRQSNQFLNDMPNVYVKTILHGVLLDQSKNLLFFYPIF